MKSPCKEKVFKGILLLSKIVIEKFFSFNGIFSFLFKHKNFYNEINEELIKKTSIKCDEPAFNELDIDKLNLDKSNFNRDTYRIYYKKSLIQRLFNKIFKLKF